MLCLVEPLLNLDENLHGLIDRAYMPVALKARYSIRMINWISMVRYYDNVIARWLNGENMGDMEEAIGFIVPCLHKYICLKVLTSAAFQTSYPTHKHT